MEGQPVRRSRRGDRGDRTRAELVAAAMRVFVENGFHGARLQEIAREAGYTTGAIYWHFGGKEELFLAAFEEYVLTRVGELAAVEPKGRDLPRRLRAYADQWMERQAAEPEFLVVALEFIAHAWRTPAVRGALAARAGAVRLAVGRIVELEAGAAGVELPMESHDVATVLRELGVGLAVAKLADPDAFRDELFGDFVEAFFRLVAGGDGSARRRRSTER